MQILSTKCTHGNEVQCPDAPELGCESCAWDIINDTPICEGCVFLSKELYADDVKRWCAKWCIYVMDGDRREAVNCSEREAV